MSVHTTYYLGRFVADMKKPGELDASIFHIASYDHDFG